MYQIKKRDRIMNVDEKIKALEAELAALKDAAKNEQASYKQFVKFVHTELGQQVDFNQETGELTYRGAYVGTIKNSDDMCTMKEHIRTKKALVDMLIKKGFVQFDNVSMRTPSDYLIDVSNGTYRILMDYEEDDSIYVTVEKKEDVVSEPVIIDGVVICKTITADDHYEYLDVENITTSYNAYVINDINRIRSVLDTMLALFDEKE